MKDTTPDFKQGPAATNAKKLALCPSALLWLQNVQLREMRINSSLLVAVYILLQIRILWFKTFQSNALVKMK